MECGETVVAPRKRGSAAKTVAQSAHVMSGSIVDFLISDIGDSAESSIFEVQVMKHEKLLID